MLTDSFRGDFNHIKRLLIEKIPFSISRFGDGEMVILNNKKIDLLWKGEFNFDGQDHLRRDLLDSFTHNQENYFVGVACPCCVGKDKSDSMKKQTGLEDSKLTWANIFVNSNYKAFRNDITPLFNNYNVTIVAKGNTDKLPFKVDHSYSVGANAWIHNADVYDKLRDQLSQDPEKHNLIILCAGPYANILSHKLFKEFPKNTIIDIGSVFNVELGIGANRGYLQGGPTLRKTCVW
jgi:hypothetical protein